MAASLGDDEDGIHVMPERKRNKRKKVKALTPEELEEFKEAEQRTGLIYFSRIPPHMKPLKLRHLMEQYGAVGRIYLQPEDPKLAKLRAKTGGNKKQNFTEGWLEFKDKKIAKTVASTLNNCKIGGKKGSFYYEDIWNIKYLPKFKWNHLTERIAYESAVRDQRLQAEISKASKASSVYLQNVEKAKEIKHTTESRKNKRKRKDTEDDHDISNKTVYRTFNQHDVKENKVKAISGVFVD